MKHLALIAAAGSMVAFAAPAQAAELPAAPAPIFAAFHDSAAPFTSVAAYDDDDWRDRRDRSRWRDRDRNRDWDDRRWDGRGDQRYWQDNNGRWRCRRDDGTVGLLVGAGVGALLGRQVDRRGDRTLGTIIGAVGGGLLGREIDRGGTRCR
ncbi:MAG: glycine zipper 2TM domain-containing protein [Sphingomonadales bacterium]|nr:MAG: glycine zipper 2TM domain-containing protein [Sphingomonadales bacterium]